MLTLSALALAAAVSVTTPPAPPPLLPPALDDSVESAAPKAAPLDSARWRAGGTLSLTDMAGNQSLTLFATKLDLQRVGGRRWELRNAFSVRYGRGNGATAVEDYAASGELRFRPQGGVSPFVTASVLRDDVRNIAVRLAASAGAAVNVVNDSLTRVAIGLAALEDYEVVETDSARLSTSRTRFSASLTGTLPIRSGVQLEHKTLLEPAASDFSDYLLSTETSVRVMLSERFALQTTWQYRRDTTPPEGVLFRNDRSLTVGITVQSG